MSYVVQSFSSEKGFSTDFLKKECKQCKTENDEYDEQGCIDGATLESLIGAKKLYKTTDDKKCWDETTYNDWLIKRKSNPNTRNTLRFFSDLFEKSLRNAEQDETFPFSEVLRLKYSGLDEESKELFKRTVGFAQEFSLPNVLGLKRNGLDEESKELFKRTVGFAQEFSLPNVLGLKQNGLEEAAIFLFAVTVGFAREFSFQNVEMLEKNGLEKEANELFDKTSFFDVIQFHESGRKVEAEKRFDETVKFAVEKGYFSDSGMIRLHVKGLKEKAKKLFTRTVQNGVSFFQAARLHESGMKEEAKELFDLLSEQKELFEWGIMPLLLPRLYESGMKEEARKLFDRTVQFATEKQKEKFYSRLDKRSIPRDNFL